MLAQLGERASTPDGNSRHQLLRVDLTDAEATADGLRQADPDLVLHLAAESQAAFRFHHISTDEVFGSLGPTGRFSETTPFDPRRPYSARPRARQTRTSLQ